MDRARRVNVVIAARRKRAGAQLSMRVHGFSLVLKPYSAAHRPFLWSRAKTPLGWRCHGIAMVRLIDHYLLTTVNRSGFRTRPSNWGINPQGRNVAPRGSGVCVFDRGALHTARDILRVALFPALLLAFFAPTGTPIAIYRAPYRTTTDVCAQKERPWQLFWWWMTS
jgi:hypothetical protein